jgi:Tfp pilus assembly protein PilV
MRLPGVLRRLRDTDYTSESGWALIETMFSAALLVVIALAVMSSMDVASRTSAATKGRTVASSLAEQDQERMRAMTINQLSNYHATADPTVGGVAYHVDSRSEWVQDTSGQVVSCSDTGQAAYVRISSTVTSNNVGRDTKPVVMRGIVAPPVGSLGPNQGTLAVKVSDRNGDPVANMPVSLSGTVALSDSTNALGCAIFAYIPAGGGTSYTVTLNTPDWVDQNDAQLSRKFPNVTPGGVTLQQMTYDQAGSATVDFRDSANQPASPAPSLMTVVNSSWTTPGPRVVTPNVAGSLFPFPSTPYNLYAGSCTSANPSTYSETVASASVLPVQDAGPVVVRVPTLTLNIKNGAGTAALAGNITIKAAGAGCPERVARTSTAPAPIGTFSVDLPYGPYTVCSDNGVAGSGGRYKIETVTNDNHTPTGSVGTTKTVQPTVGGTSGSLCPVNLP